MTFYSAEVQGNNTSNTVAGFLQTTGGYQIRSTMAYMVVFAETSSGQTASRIGGPDVGANRGIPLAVANDLFVLEPVPSSSARPWLWDLTSIYVWIANGDTVSITALCD